MGVLTLSFGLAQCASAHLDESGTAVTSDSMAGQSEAARTESDTEIDPETGLHPEELKAQRANEGLEPTFSLLSELPGFQSGGFNADRTALEFYWHGTLGPEALEIIRASEESGVPVNVIATPYSLDEILRHSNDAAQAIHDLGVTVWEHGPNRAQSGIEIVVGKSPQNVSPSDLESAASARIPGDISVEVSVEAHHAEGLVTFEHWAPPEG